MMHKIVYVEGFSTMKQSYIVPQENSSFSTPPQIPKFYSLLSLIFGSLAFLCFAYFWVNPARSPLVGTFLIPLWLTLLLSGVFGLLGVVFSVIVFFLCRRVPRDQRGRQPILALIGFILSAITLFIFLLTLLLFLAFTYGGAPYPAG